MRTLSKIINFLSNISGVNVDMTEQKKQRHKKIKRISH